MNGKFYIGKHSTDNMDDGYMGSGKNIKRAIAKYGVDKFKKKILCYCDSSEEALKVEEFLVTDYIVSRPDCYNIHKGGKGGSAKGWKMPEKGKKAISESLKGNQYHKGHKMSDELKKRLADINKGNKYSLGKKLSEETKAKMSAVRKGKSHKPTYIKPVTINGITYNSKKEACAALGICRITLDKRLKNNYYKN